MISDEEKGKLIQSVEEIKCDIRKLVDIIVGNGKEGMKAELSSAKTQLKIQWWFIALIVVSFLIDKVW